MIIANHYKTIAKKVIESCKQHEPCFVIGMCESGKNMTYRQIIKQNSNKNLFFIDLVGEDLEKNEINITTPTGKVKSLTQDSLDKYLKDQVELLENVIVILNTEDTQEHISTKFLQKFQNLRASQGTKFTFVVLSYFWIVNRSENMINTRKIFKLLPVHGEDFNLMAKRNCELFNIKPTKEQIENVEIYSGGNPGLIKTLMMQIQDDNLWSGPKLDEELLNWRISRVIEGLNNPQIETLKAVSKNKKIKNKEIMAQLESYGYIKQGKLFTNLIESKLKLNNMKDNFELYTTAELEMLELFRNNINNLVDRESIAKAIWREDYLINYSDYALDRHISNLRKKLKKENSNLTLRTIRGKGYIPIN